MFSRSTNKEIMDDVSIDDERVDEALRELSVINRWLGGDSTSRAGVRTLLDRNPHRERLTILDVGAGGSDLAETVQSLHPAVKVTALDLNFRACEYSAHAHSHLHVVCGSVFALPFRERSFDIVHVSLFLHHCTEDELGRILPSLCAVARIGVVVNDLHRSIFAFAGIWLLTSIFSRSAMIKHDGPLSVRRAFLRGDLEQLFDALPEISYTIRHRWAFRWLACLIKL